LCAFVLVVSFASFFGHLVLPYFPLWKLLPDTGLKESVKRQLFGGSAQQYGIFLLTAGYQKIPGLTTNGILD
jgi:hypothetical protein